MNETGQPVLNKKNKNMENQTLNENFNLGKRLEDCHGLVHDICFDLGQGEISKAKEQLKELDILLHDTIGDVLTDAK